MIQPVIGPVIQEPSTAHQGIDQACLLGSEVRAMANGYGKFHWSRDMGWVFTQETSVGTISISHLRYKGSDGFYQEGQVVSQCGSTGRLSAGPHVHVEGPPLIRSIFGL